MANNRLLLYHRPTGHYIYLGKRMAEGWYAPPSEEDMLAFYERCYDDLPPGGDQDDFILLAENRDTVRNPFVHVDWTIHHNQKPNDGPERFAITLGNNLAFKTTS